MAGAVGASALAALASRVEAGLLGRPEVDGALNAEPLSPKEVPALAAALDTLLGSIAAALAAEPGPD